MIAEPGAGLILASTSRYRREVLARLCLPFDCDAPGVDEAARPGEAPRALALRLARAKAEAVAARHPAAVVIGSDQVAELDGRAVGKPGDPVRARAQLAAASGKEVLFHTAVWVAAGEHGEGGCDLTRVCFRTLDEDTIARYLRRERPLDCAGSFKSEGLGITLFERIETQDPTALIGLPLILTAGLLRRHGFHLP
ncbi:MAG TPA: Maf family nucleotide pyrophosphatase [Xanthomonadaceae bacterium]|nr:Maf family nucleotide pyrophosphatase [Xanthomonadaceae bacterium]